MHIFHYCNAYFLNENGITPFISELVETEGIQNSDDNQLDFILFNKPVPSLRPKLYCYLHEAEAKDDISQQARVIILLEQEKKDPDLLAKLNKISTDERLPPKARRLLTVIISNIKNGSKIPYSDYDEFSLTIL